MLSDYSVTKISKNENPKTKFGNAEVEEFLNYCNNTLNGRKNLERLDHASTFYRMEPDIDNRVFKHLKESLFYAYKCKEYTYKIDTKVLYILKKINRQFGSVNMLYNVLSQKEISNIFAPEVIERGTCLMDYIRTFIDDSFQPLTEDIPLVRKETYAEIYLSREDKVAFIDNDIADALSYKDIDNLYVKNKQIFIGSSPLAQIGGRFGIVRSTYDLRGAV